MDWFYIAILSSILSALAAITQKRVLFDLEVENFTLLVSFFGVIISLPLLSLIHFDKINLLSLLVLLVKSVLGAYAFYFVMKSIKSLEISAALPLMVLTPGLVAFFAFILLGEALSLLEITGMFLLLTGTYILELRNIKDLFRPITIYTKSGDHYYIFLALFLFTVTSIMDKWLLAGFKLEVTAFMFFQQVFFFIFFLIIYSFKMGSFKGLINIKQKNIILLVLLIAILTFGYRYTQIEAIKIAPVALVLALKRISVFFAAIGGGKIFKEKNLLIKAFATIIMIIGAIIIARE